MMSRTNRTLRIAACMVIMLGAMAAVTAMAAADPHDAGTEAVVEKASATSNGLPAIGAGLAIGLAALGTGIAQARIGAAGIGAIAENPKRMGSVIMLIAIPETVAILGFVIAYLILSQ